MLNDRPIPRHPDPMDGSDGGPRPPDSPHAGGSVPLVVPALPRANPFAKALPWRAAFGWLRAGWGDLVRNPVPSFVYGAGMVGVSFLILWFLVERELSHLIFPALAGFLVMGPLVAGGLYEKSRRLEAGGRAGLIDMLLVRPRSGTAVLFTGVLLLGLFLLWMRASVLLWALFFGLQAFPGFDEILRTLLLTPLGWSLLLVGSAVGALFAAFAFAISAFSLPMLLNERTDALSAMGISMAMVWSNLTVMLCWGAIVLGLFVLSLLTAGLGLVITFPVLGHATWHAYRALRPADRQEATEAERLFVRPA